MEIGIGLPNAVRGVDRRGIVEWARRAEEAGFSSLGTLDRIVFPNYESLIALSAAAAVTDRIRLLTDILIAPLRSNTALLAKQVATIDSLSEGRMVLGISVGGRPDDYEVSDVDMTRRGRIFDQQLEEMTEIWSGDEESARRRSKAGVRNCSSAAGRRRRSNEPPATPTAGQRAAVDLRPWPVDGRVCSKRGAPRVGRVLRGSWGCATSPSAPMRPSRPAGPSATTTVSPAPTPSG